MRLEDDVPVLDVTAIDKFPLMQVNVDGHHIAHATLDGNSTEYVSKSQDVTVNVRARDPDRPDTEQIDVDAGELSVSIYATTARKFTRHWRRTPESEREAERYAHLNIELGKGIPIGVRARGIFAEMAGVTPMTNGTRALMKRPSLEEAAALYTSSAQAISWPASQSFAQVISSRAR